MLSLVASRLSKLSEINEKVAFFIERPPYENDLFFNKKNKVTVDSAKDVLAAVIPVLSEVSDWQNDALYDALLKVSETLSVKSGAVMWCVRIAIAGLAVTPGGATEIMEVVGKEESLSRLKSAYEKLV